MANALTANRTALAAQIASDTTYSTFAYPQPIPQARSVQVVPDDPYVESTNQSFQQKARQRLIVEMFAPLWDNQGNLSQIEDMAVTVRRSIIKATQNCGAMSQPKVMSLETGDLLYSSFQVELLTDWTL